MENLQIPDSKFQILALLSLLGFFCASLDVRAAEDFSKAFEAANQLYGQGKYSDAASAYETLIQSGSVSPTLYFNLGNARFKAAQVGQAIAAYRRAEQLSPRDPDIRANLQFARNQVQGPTLPPGRWDRWLTSLTVNEWTTFTAVAIWLWLLTLALQQMRPALKSSLKNLALGGGAAAAVLGIFLAAAWSAATQPTAIVTAQDAALRNGPLEAAQSVIPLHDGAELPVLDTKDNWLQLGIGQRVGWLKREQARQLP